MSEITKFTPTSSRLKNNFLDFSSSEKGKFSPVKEGGYGDIYKIKGTGLLKSHVYALKKLKLNMSKDSLKERFEREYQTLEHFSSSKKTIRIPSDKIEIFPDDFCILMPWIEGKSLSTVIDESSDNTSLILQNVTKTLKDVLETLNILHEEGFIHRDINPSNLMLNIEGEIIIIDFGTVYNPEFYNKYEEEYNDQSQKKKEIKPTVVVQNHGFSAQGEKPCPADDIYSLGAIAIYWITRKMPETLTGKNKPERLKEKWDNHPCKANLGELGEIISKMVDLTQEKRFKNCQEVLEELKQIPPEALEPSKHKPKWQGFLATRPAENPDVTLY